MWWSILLTAYVKDKAVRAMSEQATYKLVEPFIHYDSPSQAPALGIHFTFWLVRSSHFALWSGTNINTDWHKSSGHCSTPSENPGLPNSALSLR